MNWYAKILAGENGRGQKPWSRAVLYAREEYTELGKKGSRPFGPIRAAQAQGNLFESGPEKPNRPAQIQPDPYARPNNRGDMGQIGGEGADYGDYGDYDDGDDETEGGETPQYGEYWIGPGGEAIFADGDVGDYNHEGYIVAQAQSEIISNSDLWQYADGEYPDWDGWKNAVTSQKVEDLKRSGRTDDPEELWEEAWRAAISELNVDPQLLATAEGQGDARNFGMERYGYKRLLNNYVQTWTLTSADLRAIADGLYDAYGDAAANDEYVIEVMSNGRTFQGVPYKAIARGNPAALREFMPNWLGGFLR